MMQATNAASDAMTAQDPEPDSPVLSIDVDIRCPDWQGLADVLVAQAHYVWAHLDMPTAELSLVLADNGFSAGLNESYRGKSGPTNVLSFPAQDFEAPVDAVQWARVQAPRLLGDIVLAYEQSLAEAEAAGKTVSDHARHLVTHGLLHLLGHNHIEADEAAIMEKLETDILTVQGLADPYAVPDMTGKGGA